MAGKSMGLNERVVVITGATGRLGRAVAHRLAETGARFALVSSSAEKLEVLQRELNLAEDRIISIAVDLSQPEAAQSVLDVVVARFGRADVLLHFVGGWIGGKPVAQIAIDDVSSMLQQHLWTTFYLARVFGPHLAANGWGRVIVVSSPSVATPPANGAPYSIGKSAQEALMLTLAEEYKGTGVTANVLRVRSIDVNHERDNRPSPKTASWTTPEEIAAAILYLCSVEAGMVNGARIPLYGSP
ncbi:MAG TPA: SDR family oxidoreductase [Anaerolineales bacterium]|jgi:NAD(P)-dependent dehydrogenase (short-subunit alcohol dehydrogenase family)|nr:SDR family oxidoreductase [Anaerolineales bacterium]